MRINDRVRVKVEYLLLKELKVLVQFESCVTGGECSNEDVDASIVGLVFFLVLVDDLQTFIIHVPLVKLSFFPLKKEI